MVWCFTCRQGSRVPGSPVQFKDSANLLPTSQALASLRGLFAIPKHLTICRYLDHLQYVKTRTSQEKFCTWSKIPPTLSDGSVHQTSRERLSKSKSKVLSELSKLVVLPRQIEGRHCYCLTTLHTWSLGPGHHQRLWCSRAPRTRPCSAVKFDFISCFTYLVSEALVPSNLTLQRQEPQGSQSVVHSNVHDTLKQEIGRVAQKTLSMKKSGL